MALDHIENHSPSSPMKGVLEAKLVSAPNEEVAALVQELDAYLHGLYPAEQSHGLPLSSIFSERMRFFVLSIDGNVAGCGGVCVESNGEAELKRMYVRPSFRGKGGARFLLSRIRECAKDCGAKTLFLETGQEQVEAIGLYKSFGFQVCEIFGQYKSMDPYTVEKSVFMSMKL